MRVKGEKCMQLSLCVFTLQGGGGVKPLLDAIQADMVLCPLHHLQGLLLCPCSRPQAEKATAVYSTVLLPHAAYLVLNYCCLLLFLALNILLQLTQLLQLSSISTGLANSSSSSSTPAPCEHIHKQSNNDISGCRHTLAQEADTIVQV